MRYGLRLPEHSGKLVRSKGNWSKYHDWLEKEKIARFKDGVLIVLPKVLEKEKVGRNSPCPCNSGKKFKKCCINK